MAIECEVENTEKVFRFRLVNTETGQHTAWAPWRGVVYLDGYCAASEYYVPSDKAFKPILPEVFVRAMALGVEV